MVENRIVYINIFSRSVPYYYKDLFLEQGKSLFNLEQTVYFTKFNLSVLSTTGKDIVAAYNKKTFPKKYAIINNKDNLIYSVATDSYRLAEKTIPNTKDLDFSFLIPQKHIPEILQIINEEDGEISLSRSNNIITFTSTTITLSIHTIIGNFPDYRQLFPKEFTTTITLSKEELQKALLLTTFFNDHYSQVECIFSNKKCTVHSKSEKIGQVTHSITTTQNGDDIEVKYNNKFFLEVLPYIEGDIITCMFTTPNKPLFIQGKKDITFTYLLMPLMR